MKQVKLLFVRLVGLILILLALPVVWGCTAFKLIADKVIYFIAIFNVKYYLFFGDNECALIVLDKIKHFFE